jgi:hypothetical protein
VGIAKMGIDVWPQSRFLSQGWFPAFALGTTLSPVIQVTFKQLATPEVNLTATDVLFETGSLFG